MKPIKLRAGLIEKVVSGEKTATTRLGAKNYQVGKTYIFDPEDTLNAVPVIVDGVMIVSFKTVQNSNVFQKEGYSTPEEFEAVLKQFYPELTADSTVTVISFSTCCP